MGLFKQLRSSLENPQTPLSYPAEWLLDIFNGGRTDAGLRVSQGNSMQVSAVYACVRVIAEGLASLPLNIYERIKPRGRRLAEELDLFDLLHDEPNPEMTSFVFRETLQGHLCLWGNAYAEIQRDGANRVVGLWPRNPSKTRPVRIDNQLVYTTTDGMTQGGERKIAADDILHIPGLGFDGIVGLSPIEQARQAIGLSLATEKFGAKFFGNGSRPGGVLSHPGKLSDIAADKLKASWQAAQGGENAHKVAVLEEGLTWTAVGIPPEQAQFLETRKFQKSEIAAFFRVPAHMVGDLERATHSNIEHQSLEFVIYTLTPWLVRWEQELNRKLFSKFGQKAGKYFTNFYIDGLLRGDFKSRQDGYAVGRQWGWLSANDVCELENRNPIGDQGDIYLVPMNMVPADSVEDAAAAADTDAGNDDGNGGTTGDGTDVEDGGARALQIGRFVSCYLRLFRDAMGRLLTREKRDSLAFYGAFAPVLISVSEMIARQAAEEMRTDAAISEEIESFVRDYIGGMEKRAGEWTAENADELAKTELGRAVRALLVSVYRDAATRKAKGAK